MRQSVFIYFPGNSDAMTGCPACTHLNELSTKKYDMHLILLNCAR